MKGKSKGNEGKMKGNERKWQWDNLDNPADLGLGVGLEREMTGKFIFLINFMMDITLYLT